MKAGIFCSNFFGDFNLVLVLEFVFLDFVGDFNPFLNIIFVFVFVFVFVLVNLVIV